MLGTIVEIAKRSKPRKVRIVTSVPYREKKEEALLITQQDL